MSDRGVRDSAGTPWQGRRSAALVVLGIVLVALVHHTRSGTSDAGSVELGQDIPRRRQRTVHGYFWAWPLTVSTAEDIARSFAHNLSCWPGLVDGLVVINAVKSRVVIASDNKGLSYLLVEPVHANTTAPLQGVPPPALTAVWDEAGRQGIKLYGGLGMLPTNWSYVGSSPSYPWHSPAREWFVVDPYHEDFTWRSLAPTVESIVRSCRELGLSGIVVNDECGWWKPRSSQSDFEAFIAYADALANALHSHGLELHVTMAIPYELGTSLEEIKLLLHRSSVDRFVFMDPYWGTLHYAETHITNWSAPYSYHGEGGIGSKYAPLVWNHPVEQFGENFLCGYTGLFCSQPRPMTSLLEFIGSNTSVDDLWLWVFPGAMQWDQRGFISDVRDWKAAQSPKYLP